MLTGLKPVTFKHLFRRSHRYVRKYRSSTWKAHTGRAGQIEDIISIQKKSKHVRSADHRNAALRNSQHRHGAFQSGAGGIPEKSLCVGGIRRGCRDSMSQNQPMPQIRMSLLLVRMPPMHDHVDAIQTAFEEGLIGFEFKGVGHHACGIRQHAVLGNDGISLDTAWALWTLWTLRNGHCDALCDARLTARTRSCLITPESGCPAWARLAFQYQPLKSMAGQRQL